MNINIFIDFASPKNRIEKSSDEKYGAALDDAIGG